MLSALTTILLASAVTTSIWLPFFVKPAPAVIEPAPLNWLKKSPVVPTVMLPSVVRTQPLSALTDPSSTNVKRPEVTSALTSASTALDQAEASTT